MDDKVASRRPVSWPKNHQAFFRAQRIPTEISSSRPIIRERSKSSGRTARITNADMIAGTPTRRSPAGSYAGPTPRDRALPHLSARSLRTRRLRNVSFHGAILSSDMTTQIIKATDHPEPEAHHHRSLHKACHELLAQDGGHRALEANHARLLPHPRHHQHISHRLTARERVLPRGVSATGRNRNRTTLVDALSHSQRPQLSTRETIRIIRSGYRVTRVIPSITRSLKTRWRYTGTRLVSWTQVQGPMESEGPLEGAY